MGKVRNRDFQFDMSEEDVEAATEDPVFGEEMEDSSDTEDEDDDLSIKGPMDYHPLKLPQEQIDKMRAEYEYVVLQDFGDDYDLTAEEMRERYQFYSVFERLRTMQAKYRNLANYIYAFREAMKCLNAVAEANEVYSKDKFIKLVLSGEIKVSGLKFPRYNGSKSSKMINWEKVVTYIMDETLDPEDLLRKENSARFEIATDDDIERMSNQYFDGNMQEALDEAYRELEEEDFVDIEDGNYDGSNIIIPMTAKEEKNFLKIHRTALEGIKQFGQDRKATGRQLRDYAYQMTSADFDEFARIEKIDKSRGDRYLDIPIFTGDIANDEDVDRYLMALEEYELYHTRVEYHNKMITVAEANELSLKDLMEESGWNVRAMYNYAKDEKKEKRKLAKMEKKKKHVKKRLLKIEALLKGESVNTKKKKHNKKTKLKDTMNKGLERALSDGYSSFDSMQKVMEGWDNDD